MKTVHAVLLSSIFALSLVGNLALSGPVVDEAALLRPEQKNELLNLLTEYEKSSGNQIIVVSVKSLQGESIEEFGNKLGRAWGIGSKELNNGVLLIVAPHERKVRIEVGYGLEDTLTDAASKLIIERIILPQFREGELAQGIIEGTKAIISTLGGQTAVAPEEEKESPNFIFVIALFFFLFILIMSSRGSGRGPRPPFSRGPFYRSDRNSGMGGMGGRGGGGSFGGGGASGSW